MRSYSYGAYTLLGDVNILLNEIKNESWARGLGFLSRP